MRARYVEYKAGKVSEEAMCGEMVTMHKGLSEAAMMKAATEFMGSAFPGRIFPEMQELVRRLHETGCEIWAVSSSNEWIIRAGMRQFGIAGGSHPGGESLAWRWHRHRSVGASSIGPGKAEGFARSSAEGNRRSVWQFTLGRRYAGDGEARLRG